MFFFNKNSYKQICLVILSSFFIISCGEKSQNPPKKDETVKESAVYNSGSIEKYNDYISFYNSELSSVNYALNQYLESQGDEKKLKKHKQPFKHFSSEVNNKWWNTKKEISKKKPAFKELDEAAEALIPPAEELIQLLNTAAKYYQARDYLDDKYEKGIELHTKIWATGKIFITAYAKFDEALRNKETEIRNAEMDYAKKTGNAFDYNKIMVSILMEKIIKEFETQQLSDKNVASIDLSKIKPLYDEFNQAQRALREAQENQNISSYSMYISSTTSFKLKLLELIEKIEKKGSVQYEYNSLYENYERAISYYNRHS